MQFCILHKELPFSRFCLSCEQSLCLECATISHTESTNCTVIPLEDISNEIRSRIQDFSISLDSVERENNVLSQMCDEEKQNLSKDNNFTRAQIEKDCEYICKELKQERSTLVDKVIKIEISKVEKLLYVRRKVRKVQRAIENLGNRLDEASSEDELSELVKLREIENLIEGVNDNLNEIEGDWMKDSVELAFAKAFNNGMFGCLSLWTLIGSVIISPKQLVHVFDSRRENGGVFFICIDNEKHKMEFWRHLLKVEDHCSPVLMSEKSVFCAKQQVLIAVGKTVYSLRPHFKELYDGIGSLQAITLDDLNEGEWITSITSHQPSYEPSYEFLISVSNSSVLREYEVSGQALRRIEIKDYVSSISCVSYVFNMFAVISEGHDDVTLLLAGNTVQVCGTLKAPPCSHCRLLPKVVLWTGFRWLVLWIGRGRVKKWRVVRYIATGEQMKVCDEGVSQCYMEVPVSITRSRDTGYVSFKDGTFRTFEY